MNMVVEPYSLCKENTVFQQGISTVWRDGHAVQNDVWDFQIWNILKKQLIATETFMSLKW